MAVNRGKSEIKRKGARVQSKKTGLKFSASTKNKQASQRKA